MKINLNKRMISLLLAAGIFFTGTSLTGCVKRSNDSDSIKIEGQTNNNLLISYSKKLSKKLNEYNISEQEILVFLTMNKALLNQDVDVVASEIIKFMNGITYNLSPENDYLDKIYLDLTKAGYNITKNQIIDIINSNPVLINKSLSKTIDNIKYFIDNEYTANMDLKLIVDKITNELNTRGIDIEKDFILSTIILKPDIVKDTISNSANEFESYIIKGKLKK